MPTHLPPALASSVRPAGVGGHLDRPKHPARRTGVFTHHLAVNPLSVAPASL